MKIVFCDNSLKEMLNFRGDVIGHFINKGYSIVLVAPNNIQSRWIDDSVKVYSPTLERSGMNPVKDFIYLIRLIKIYRIENPDIVFHYTIKPNIYGSIAAKLCGIPSVAMITGLGYSFFHKGVRTRVARSLYHLAMKFPKKILVLNQTNLDTLIKLNIISKDKALLLSGGEGINIDTFK